MANPDTSYVVLGFAEGNHDPDLREEAEDEWMGLTGRRVDQFYIEGSGTLHETLSSALTVAAAKARRNKANYYVAKMCAKVAFPTSEPTTTMLHNEGA